jgi:hypothetical protein
MGRSGKQKGKQGEKIFGDEELEMAFSSLQEPLDKFNQDLERELAKVKTPPLSVFTALVQNNKAAAQRKVVSETLTFIFVAFAFLTLIGDLLRAGYLMPIALIYQTATLLLPTVILFTPVYREKEAREK